jgi:hypothetical protein
MDIMSESVNHIDPGLRPSDFSNGIPYVRPMNRSHSASGLSIDELPLPRLSDALEYVEMMRPEGVQSL